MKLEPRSIRNAECVSGVGPGWYEIVRAAEVLLDAVAPGWKPAQVKEKFGQLRFYVDAPSEIYTDAEAAERWKDESAELVSQITEAALIASSKTCEICGRPGRSRNLDRGGFGVLMTRCDGCWEDEQRASR